MTYDVNDFPLLQNNSAHGVEHRSLVFTLTTTRPLSSKIELRGSRKQFY